MKILLGLVVLLSSGCSYNLKFDPVAASGQKERFDNGVGILTSSKVYTVIVAPNPSVYNESDQPMLAVYVVNNSTNEFNFSTDNIKAFVGDEELKVYSYEDLFVKIQRKSEFASLGVILNSAIQSANAAYSQTNSNFSSTQYGPNGQIITSQGSINTVNAGESNKAQREISNEATANLSGIAARKELAITNINSTILRKTTIMPGTINGGYVTLSKIPLPEPKKGFAYFECRRKSAGVGGYDGSCDRYLNKQADTVPKPVDAVDVKVIVTIEGERHEFTFRQSNVKS